MHSQCIDNAYTNTHLVYALLEVGHAMRIVARPLAAARLVRDRGRVRVGVRFEIRVRVRVSGQG